MNTVGFTLVWLVTRPGGGSVFFNSRKKWCSGVFALRSNLQCLQGSGHQGLAGILGHSMASVLRFAEIHLLHDEVG